MKKLFILFTIAILVIGVAACSSDDDAVENTSLKEVFLKADRNRINENETVTFTAVDSESKLVDVEFYINGLEVGKKHKFEKRGVYIVTAKRDGYKVNSPLAIQVVKEGEVVVNTLELSADKYEMYTGEVVKFTVTDGNNFIYKPNVFLEGTELSVDEVWVPSTPGEYKFICHHYGYFDSNVITINVKQKPVDENKYFTIDDVKFSINQTALYIYATPDNKPILFSEEVEGVTSYYYVYSIYYIDTEYTFVTYSMKVYVPKNSTEVILPYEVDKSKVVPYEYRIIFETELVDTFPADQFEVKAMEWKKPFVEAESPGEMKSIINFTEGTNRVVFEGEYKGLYPEYYVNEDTQSMKLSRNVIKIPSKSKK